MTDPIGGGGRRTKLVTSFVIYYCTFAVACAYLFLSPAVIDLSQKYETSVERVSKVFTIITSFFIVGALICGYSYKYVNRQGVVILLLAVQSLAIILTPFCPTLALVFVAHACIGFAVGGLDTAFVTWIIEIWQDECAPYIMAHEFAFGIGIFLPAFIFQPFLASKTQVMAGAQESVNSSSNFLPNSTNIGGSDSPRGTIPSSGLPSEPPPPGLDMSSLNIVIPYIIGSIILGLAAIFQLGHLIGTRRSNESDSEVTPSEDDPKTPLLTGKKTPPPSAAGVSGEIVEGGDKHGNTMWRHVTLVSLSCLIIGFYMAEEFNAIEFLATFSVYSPLALTEAQGDQVLLVMTLTFAVTRGLCIFISFKVSSEVILFVNFVLIAVSNTILLIWGGEQVAMLWTASVLMGVGLSTVFPCYFAFIQKYVEITDRVSSLILVFGGITSAVYPIVVGRAVEHNPPILCYINFISIAITSVAFAVVYAMTAMRRNV